MPAANHHEVKITPLKESRFAARVDCLGCNWQAHVLKEENAADVAKRHQNAWGYEPKAPLKQEPPKAQQSVVASQPKVVPQPAKVEVKK